MTEHQAEGNQESGNENQPLSTPPIESKATCELSVGRELDAAVAERVMKWKRVHSDRDEGDDRKDVAWMLHYRNGVLKGEPYSSMNGLYDRTFAKWSPSADIAAAMEAVNAMIAGPWNFTLIYNKAIAPECGQWVAWFENFITGQTVHSGAATAAEAVCRAALQAVEQSDLDFEV